MIFKYTLLQLQKNIELKNVEMVTMKEENKNKCKRLIIFI